MLWRAGITPAGHLEGTAGCPMMATAHLGFGEAPSLILITVSSSPSQTLGPQAGRSSKQSPLLFQALFCHRAGEETLSAAHLPTSREQMDWSMPRS